MTLDRSDDGHHSGDHHDGDAATPRVSVCVPLYDKAAYVGRTVASVLEQTFTDFELVVLDNASTDGSGAVVAGFADPRVRLERNPATVPAPENFNRVVALSRGPLVKVLNADDTLDPTILARQVAAMDADPGLAVVSCRHDLIDDDDHVVAPARALSHPDLIGRRDAPTVLRRVMRHRGSPLGVPGDMLFRRAAFDACGGYPDNAFALDVALGTRLVTQGAFLGQAESLSRFRLASGSMTSTARRRNQGLQRRFLRELRREHPGVIRTRDVVAGLLRAPVTWLWGAVMVRASTDPTSWRHRLAAVVLGTPSHARHPRKAPSAVTEHR